MNRLSLILFFNQIGRSDKASSGVAFTIDPDSGFQKKITISSCWGLGENIVQGIVIPDEWMVFKHTLFNEKINPNLKNNCGRKEYTMVYVENTEGVSAERIIVNFETTVENQNKFSLTYTEVNDSISFNPDTLIKGIENIVEAESIIVTVTEN
jgi:pyruvate,water dikinase